MGFWVTQDGFYYESDGRMHSSDIAVPKRPGKEYYLINGNWVSPRHHTEPDDVEPDDMPLPVHRIRIRANPDVAPPMAQFVSSPQSPQPKDDKSVVLNNDTKVMFGIKELAMVAAFVVTATVSWTDTNSRIVKLEDPKVAEALEARLRSIEAELKSQDRQHRDTKDKLEQNIRELEQIVFMKGKK